MIVFIIMKFDSNVHSKHFVFFTYSKTAGLTMGNLQDDPLFPH
jgi:hypothetical protein